MRDYTKIYMPNFDILYSDSVPNLERKFKQHFYT